MPTRHAGDGYLLPFGTAPANPRSRGQGFGFGVWMHYFLNWGSLGPNSDRQAQQSAFGFCQHLDRLPRRHRRVPAHHASCLSIGHDLSWICSRVSNLFEKSYFWSLSMSEEALSLSLHSLSPSLLVSLSLSLCACLCGCVCVPLSLPAPAHLQR